MLPVVFEIPTPWSFKIPIYSFGLMLVIALFASTWLACRRAQKEGITKERIQDLALWVVICGILGARIVWMRQYDRSLSEFFQLWQAETKAGSGGDASCAPRTSATACSLSGAGWRRSTVGSPPIVASGPPTSSGVR